MVAWATAVVIYNYCCSTVALGWVKIELANQHYIHKELQSEVTKTLIWIIVSTWSSRWSAMFPMSIAIQPQEGFSAPSLHIMVVLWLLCKMVTFLEQGQRRPSYSYRLRGQQRRRHWGWSESQLFKTIDHLTCRVFLPVAIIMKSQYCLSSGTRMTTMSRSCEKI